MKYFETFLNKEKKITGIHDKLFLQKHRKYLYMYYNYNSEYI